MLLANDNVDVTIDIRNKRIFYNEGIRDLLGNIGVDVGAISEDTDFVIIQNGGEQSVTLDNFRKNKCTSNTAIGNIQITYHGESDEYYSLLVDDVEYMEGSNEDDTSMQICVRRNGEVIDTVKFNYIINPDNNKIELSSAQR
jgi:hypothetical protein